MGMCECMHVHEKGNFVCHFPGALYFMLEMWSLLGRDLHQASQAGRSGNSKDLPILTSHLPDNKITKSHHLAFYVFWELSSDPHSCMASALLTKPFSLNPKLIVFPVKLATRGGYRRLVVFITTGNLLQMLI